MEKIRWASINSHYKSSAYFDSKGCFFDSPDSILLDPVWFKADLIAPRFLSSVFAHAVISVH